MKCSVLYFTSLLLLGFCSGCHPDGKSTKDLDEKPDKPNILFIFADDQCYSTISALENNEIHTPNLDKLVNSGVSFTHTYNMGSWGGAVCVASRAMLNQVLFVNRGGHTPKKTSGLQPKTDIYMLSS